MIKVARRVTSSKIPEIIPRFFLVVISTVYAPRAASVAMAPKKVIIQSNRIAKEAASHTGSKKAERGKMAVVMGQNANPTIKKILRFPLESLRAPMNIVVRVDARALKATKRET